jgi:hypothetical protein
LGLVGFYRFEGDVLDDSGYGNDGSLEGDASFVDDSVRGLVLGLDGVGDYVSTSLAVDHTLYNYTYLFWLKPLGSGGFYSLGVGGPGCEIDSGGRVYCTCADGDSGYSVHSLDLGEWSHVALSYHSDIEYDIYLDGVYESTAQMDEGNIGEFFIGSGFYPREFNGSVDNVRVYNKVLTQTEIQDIYDMERRGI